MTEQIDVAIPTYGGEDVIDRTLDRLESAEEKAPVSINRVLVDYRPTDGERWKPHSRFDVSVVESERNLPDARQALIDRVDTEWFLFLDDDVALRPETLRRLCAARSGVVGAVQSRKARQGGPNAEWSKWRPVRATFFATLLRTDAVADLSIPSEVTVLEEEYTRQYIENEHGYLWVFDHQAVVDHDNQGRHAIDFNEGYLAGKYGLLPYWYVFLNIPYNVARMNHPLRHTARGLGYLYGKVKA